MIIDCAIGQDPSAFWQTGLVLLIMKICQLIKLFLKTEYSSVVACGYEVLLIGKLHHNSCGNAAPKTILLYIILR